MTTADAAAAAAAAAAAPDTCRRTLIIEDDLASRRALERLVRASGHETRSAASVADGLGQLHAWQPDCVILDLMLPHGPGTAVLEQVRRGGRPTRVAVATGAHGPLLADAEALAPDALFRKPLDVPRLLAWLAGKGGN